MHSKNSIVVPLREPLAVDIVSATQQRFNGILYTRWEGERRYFVCLSKHGKLQRGNRYLHRAVWEYHYGPIPIGKKYHVHHKDGNRANNQIENLELLTCLDHIRHHYRQDPEAWIELRKGGLIAAREAAKEWHRSEEGRAWHLAHYQKTAERLHARDVPCTCVICGKDYLATRASVYCGRNCKATGRRRSGVDDVMRPCVVCGTPFKVNQYAVQKCCGRPCGMVLASARRLQRKAAA